MNQRQGVREPGVEIVRSRAGPQGDSCRGGRGGSTHDQEARGWLTFRLSTKLWHLEKPCVYFMCPLSSTRHLGLSFWRRRREPSLKRQPECFLGRSTHQLTPPLATGVRTGFHLSWARECSVPPAWARLSLTFSSASPCFSAFYFLFFALL